MKISDALSLLGQVLVVVLLLHAARHGPMQPVYEVLTLQPAPAVIEPGPMTASEPAGEPTPSEAIARRME